MKKVIIIGSKEDFHSRYILEELHKKKIKAHYFDSRKYPIFSWSFNDENDYIILNDEKILTKDIQGIYWRWYYGVTSCRTEMIYREKTSAMESFLYGLKSKSYNSIQAVELHRKKGAQTMLMGQSGIRIPQTIITNDKNIIEDFYNKNDKEIIYKPVRGGAYTKKLLEKDFKRLNTLINCPVQFQEYIDGVDIRIYAFESGEIFAGEINAKTVDFRQDEFAEIKKTNLPKKVQKDCLKVMKILGLKYSGIDVRKKKNGEYVFIEANPAPMFYHFEKKTQYPITETLINNLIKEK